MDGGGGVPGWQGNVEAKGENLEEPSQICQRKFQEGARERKIKRKKDPMLGGGGNQEGEYGLNGVRALKLKK